MVFEFPPLRFQPPAERKIPPKEKEVPIPKELQERIRKSWEEILKEEIEIKAEDLCRKIQEVGLMLEREEKENQGKLKNVKNLEDLKNKKFEKPIRDGSFVALPTEGEVLVVGDIHGDAQALRSIALEFLERLERGEKVYLLFLGDYCDRGLKQVEVMNIILTLKANFGENVILLRGNHETENVAKGLGTSDPVLLALRDKFEEKEAQEVFKSYVDLFEKLPIVAGGGDSIFMHGAPPVGKDGKINITSLEELTKLSKEQIAQILWNDPTVGVTRYDPHRGWQVGVGEIREFLAKMRAQRLVRGHEALNEPKTYGENILTIFSTGNVSPDQFYYDVTPRILELNLSTGDYEIRPIDLSKIAETRIPKTISRDKLQAVPSEPPPPPFRRRTEEPSPKSNPSGKSPEFPYTPPEKPPYVPSEEYPSKMESEAERQENLEQEQLERLREVLGGIMERERERFLERYGVGTLGWLSRLFEGLGAVGIAERIRSADNFLKLVTGAVTGTFLHRVGRFAIREEGGIPRAEFEEEAWQTKRWGKILVRTLGGLGLVAFSAFSGTGILTPFLWVEGLRQTAMGITEALQEIGGVERGREEVERYRGLVEAINNAVQKAQERNLTEEDIRAIFERERELTQRYRESTEIESRNARIRAWIGSGVAAAISVGFGVPLGRHILQGPPVGLETVMSTEGHRIVGRFFGESIFLYGPGELEKVATIAQSKGWGLTVLQWFFGQPGHIIGHELFGLPRSLLWGSQIYNLARGFIDHLLARRGRIPVREEYLPPQVEYLPPTPGYPYPPTEYILPQEQYVPPERYPLPPPEKLSRERLREAKENAQAIVDSYFEKARENPEYKSEFDQLVETLPKEPPSSETRLIISIPAHVSEHKNIKDALEAIAKELRGKENIKPQQTEIVIFVNANNKISESDFEGSLREFQERVEEFRKDNPEINIIIVPRRFEETKNFGFIRKLATDLALYRSREVIAQTGRSPVILSIDADIKGFSENYISNALSIMEERELGLVAGVPEIGDPEKFRQFPILLAAQRLWDFVKFQFGTRRWFARLPYTTGGGGIFIKPEVYARAGGFDEKAVIAEDLTLGAAVYRAGIPFDVYSRLRVYTSHRRSADQLASGLSFVTQWAEWTEKDNVRYPETIEEAEEKLKEMGLEGERSLESKEFAKALEREANDVTLALLTQTLARPFERSYLGIKNWKELISRTYETLSSAFFFWGLDKYEFRIGEITIRWEKRRVGEKIEYKIEYECAGKKYSSLDEIPEEHFVLDDKIDPKADVAYRIGEIYQILQNKISVKIENFDTLKNGIKRVCGFKG